MGHPELKDLLASYRGPDEAAAEKAISDAATISMLSVDVLQRLLLLASLTDGPILEIGPYIGGSTTALATGARLSGARITSIEAGGSHPTHPTRPSSDILADLHANLRRWDNESRVSVIDGFAQDNRVRHRAWRAMGRRPAKLLFIDADGDIRTVLFRYRRLLADDAVLVFDDYLAPGAPDKELLVRAFVDSMVKSGAFTGLGVFKYGTWFGRLNGERGRNALEQLEPVFTSETGQCYTFASIFPMPASTVEHPERSSLVVLEDGQRIGPGNAIHDEIRRVGCGAYSHWLAGPDVTSGEPVETTLYLSTPDNSNPNTNGRTYTFAIDGAEVDPGDVI